MTDIDKYQDFLLSEWKREAHRKKETTKIIKDINDRILPGIQDILSTYQDEQDIRILASLIDDRKTFTTRGNVYVCVYSEDEITPIKNSKDIISRVLLEFGDDIKIDTRERIDSLSGPNHILFYKYIGYGG